MSAFELNTKEPTAQPRLVDLLEKLENERERLTMLDGQARNLANRLLGSEPESDTHIVEAAASGTLESLEQTSNHIHEWITSIEYSLRRLNSL